MQPGTHPKAFITVKRAPEHLQTSITLQDGCFGIGMLLRIAAIFVKPLPTQPGSLPVPAGTHVSSEQSSHGQRVDVSSAVMQSTASEQHPRPKPEASSCAPDGHASAHGCSDPGTINADAAVDMGADAPSPSLKPSTQPASPRPRVKMKSSSTAPDAAPPVPSDRFSLEVVRCVAICPDVPDHATARGSISVALELPHALLQLPARDPASHPREHAIQTLEHMHDDCMDAHNLMAPHAGDDSAVIFSLTQAVVQIGPVDRVRKASRPDIHRVVTIPSVLITSSVADSSSASAANPPSSHLVLTIPTVHMSADAEQLAAVSMAWQWSRDELGHIIGHQSTAPAHSHQRAYPPQSRKQPGSGLGFCADADVGSISIVLHGLAASDPSLTASLQHLKLHAAASPTSASYIGTLQELSLSSSSTLDRNSSAMDLIQADEIPLPDLGRLFSEPLVRSSSAPSHSDASAIQRGSLDFADRAGVAVLVGPDSDQRSPMESAPSSGLAEAAGFGLSPRDEPSTLMTSWRAARAARGHILQRISSGEQALCCRLHR